MTKEAPLSHTERRLAALEERIQIVARATPMDGAQRLDAIERRLEELERQVANVNAFMSQFPERE